MAQRRPIEVELSEYLADQDLVALKGLVSAPIAFRVERLLTVLRDARQLGSVGPSELISALLHATPPDLDDLRSKVAAYREARVWETRQSAGDITNTEGKWRIRLKGPGERYGA
ncbi:MAG: hypothetical protein ACJ768_03465 [Gaiellaceae bacterium]